MASAALVEAPRRLVHEQPRRLVADGHLGEHELDRLVLRDRHAERLALLRVAHALVERAAHEPVAPAPMPGRVWLNVFIAT